MLCEKCSGHQQFMGSSPTYGKQAVQKIHFFTVLTLPISWISDLEHENVTHCTIIMTIFSSYFTIISWHVTNSKCSTAILTSGIFCTDGCPYSPTGRLWPKVLEMSSTWLYSDSWVCPRNCLHRRDDQRGRTETTFPLQLFP